MITNHFSRGISLILLGCSLGAFEGCSVTRRGASVDSTSRMPFFNMELAPKRKEPAPETQRIRWDQSKTVVETEPAKLTANTPAGENSSWWQRLTGTEKKTAVPLPRTDLLESGSAASKPLAFPASTAPIEF